MLSIPECFLVYFLKITMNVKSLYIITLNANLQSASVTLTI